MKILVIILLLLSGCTYDSSINQVSGWQERENKSFSGDKLPDYMDIGFTVLTLASEFTYISDREKYNLEEYWQTYDETVEDMTGDCEDFAILAYVTLSLQGYDQDYIGMVRTHDGDGGHIMAAIFPSGKDNSEDIIYLSRTYIMVYRKDYPEHTLDYGFDIESQWYY